MESSNFQRIEMFLCGLMATEESAAFKTDLKLDAGLRNQAQAMAMMIQQMQQQRMIEAQQVVQEVQQVACECQCADAACETGETTADDLQKSANTTKRWRNSLRRFMSIAATVLVMLCVTAGGLQWYATSRANTLFAHYYEQADLPVSRGSGDGTVVLSGLFDRIGSTSGDKLAMTVQQLEHARSQADTDYDYYNYLYDIEWYLALGHIKLHQLDKARDVLSIAIGRNDTDNRYLDRERALYGHIRHLHCL